MVGVMSPVDNGQGARQEERTGRDAVASATVRRRRAHLEIRDVTKFYGTTRALHRIHLSIYPGEVIGLVGSNGAGKSTLMKTITGVVQPTEGDVVVDGEAAGRYDVRAAQVAGVSCVYQELSLCTNLSVYENFIVHYAGDSQFRGKGWRRRAIRFANDSLERVFPGHRIDVTKPVEEYSLAQRQMIEIARASVSDRLRVLILDEPTSSLTSDRIQQLHDFMQTLTEKGVAIIYVSHKLEEIGRVSHRIVVMRNGERIWEGDAENVGTEDLIHHLGGEAAAGRGSAGEAAGGATAIDVQNVTTKELAGISMHVKEGEIVGISGLEGSGQKALLHAIFEAGRGRVPGVNMQKKVAFVSGDRQREGIFPLWSIADNMLISSMHNVSRFGLLSARQERHYARYWFDRLKFKAENESANITSLSGGNQQKALIARGLASEADVILLDDPTRGVDIGTKQEIYRLMQEAKANGKSVVWYSTEDAEMEQCDRVYVMKAGRVAGELRGGDITIANIVHTSFEGGSLEPTAAANDRDNQRGALSGIALNLLSARSMLPILTLVILLGLNAAYNANSVSYMGITFLVGAAIPLVFAALAQMFLTLAGDIDLGIGSAIGFANVVVAAVVMNHAGIGLLACAGIVAGYAAVGVLVHRRQIPSIIVTLGMSFVWLGIALLVQPTPGGAAPSWLTAFYNFAVPGVPMPVLIAAAAALITYWIVKRSKYGVILRGFGNHPAAVSQAGWSHLAARVALYAMAGACVVLAGFATTAISHGSDVNASSSFTLMSIATIILGGCAFQGGRVEPIGVVCGAVAISLISSLLVFASVSTDFQSAAVGLVLLASLAANLLIPKRGR